MGRRAAPGHPRRLRRPPVPLKAVAPLHLLDSRHLHGHVRVESGEVAPDRRPRPQGRRQDHQRHRRRLHHRYRLRSPRRVVLTIVGIMKMVRLGRETAAGRSTGGRHCRGQLALRVQQTYGGGQQTYGGQSPGSRVMPASRMPVRPSTAPAASGELPHPRLHPRRPGTAAPPPPPGSGSGTGHAPTSGWLS